MPEPTITPEHIAAAETLAGLSYSADQRDLMLKPSANASPTTKPSAPFPSRIPCQWR